MKQEFSPQVFKLEIEAQREAVHRMAGDELELTCIYAENFRKTIKDFEAQEGRVPTAEDLIWIESERQHCDLTQHSLPAVDMIAA